MLKRNDIILIYDDDQPFAFARIEVVIKALKPGEYWGGENLYDLV
jgi:hypothetical protein